MLTLKTLIYLSLFAAAVTLWWQHMGLRDRVMHFTRDYCQRHGYQLLDESLVFSGFRLLKDRRGRRRLCRLYRFDVSTNGIDRYSGDVALHRERIFRVIIDTDQREIADFS